MVNVNNINKLNETSYKWSFIEVIMKIRPIIESDYPTIDSWYQSREMETVPHSLFPKHGFIVDNGAAGFLYVADGGLGLIEGIITPKDSTHGDRVESVNAVVYGLVDKAKELGLKKLMTVTKIKNIYDMCLQGGARDIGSYQVLIKDL